MVVSESSHDRFCSEESPKNVPSTITIPVSDFRHKGPLFGPPESRGLFTNISTSKEGIWKRLVASQLTDHLARRAIELWTLLRGNMYTQLFNTPPNVAKDLRHLPSGLAARDHPKLYTCIHYQWVRMRVLIVVPRVYSESGLF